MAVRPTGQQQQFQVYVQLNTNNQSFLDMHYYLKDVGVKNNNFFLALVDKDLMGIDPRDPNLNTFMKRKVLRECIVNYWYFIREIIRIPDQGGTVGGGAKYKLHRGNLALNFGFVRNWNMFLELPRQQGKTVSALCRYLWVFNFGTSNSEAMFINKKHDDSKLNLSRFKELRESLPSYLSMESAFGSDGKKLRKSNTVETLEHPTNRNKIKTLPAARNKVAANGLGRGLTTPIIWYDEYAFIPFNNIIYLASTPAYKTASINAKRNGSPCGILITTTPGDLTTEEGLSAYDKKNAATMWDEKFYDYDETTLSELLMKNTSSKFIYMRYTYQQLGCDENWFREICIEMEKNWTAIRREVLLEWSRASDNSPFTKEDLNVVKSLTKEPIRTITLCNFFQFLIYEPIDIKNPPIIGVDVSGGFKKDSSCITVIDSKTTKVCATFNCNYISIDDLTKVIYELVTKYMPNAVVNVERNGGYGAAVVSKLMKSSIKKNLYYEIKDRIIEEKFVHGRAIRSSQRTKVYGLDSSKAIRNELMEILRERMEYHKDKFIAPVIYDELAGLEVKKNGRIEHSSNTHDDQIFSYLLALYVWYNGNNLKEIYGIEKGAIKSDQAFEDALVSIEGQFIDIGIELLSEEDETVQAQLEALNDGTMSHNEFIKSQDDEDRAALNKLLSDPVASKAYAEKYNLDPAGLGAGHTVNLPDEIFTGFYD